MVVQEKPRLGPCQLAQWISSAAYGTGARALLVLMDNTSNALWWLRRRRISV